MFFFFWNGIVDTYILVNKGFNLFMVNIIFFIKSAKMILIFPIACSLEVDIEDFV